MNYENDVRIDDSALDVEWLQQPTLMFKYAKMVAEASMELDNAKEALSIVRAGLDKAIRETPEKYDIAKVTETAISNAILMQDDYQQANQEVIQAMYDMNISRAAVQAIDQKKTALENLVRLHGQQYFAGPKVPRDLNKEWEQKQRQSVSNQKVAAGMSRKK